MVLARAIRPLLGAARARGIAASSTRGARFCFGSPTANRAATGAVGIRGFSGIGSDAPNSFARTPQEEEVIRDLFLSFATEGDATAAEPCLRVDELRDLLLSIGERPSDERLRRLIDEVDADRSGTIEYDEFLSGCNAILGRAGGPDVGSDDATLDVGSMVRTFRTLDRDGDGVLTLEELEGLLSTSGGHLSTDDARRIMELADKDGSGSIDLTEFMDLMTNPELGNYSWRIRSGFRVFLVMGGPGCGKGTLCDLLVQRAGVRHFSSGEMLREEIASGSPLAKSIEQTMQAGGLIPSTTIIALLKKQLRTLPGTLVALDGFPRNVENYRDFDAVCGKPEFALYVDVPDDVMLERIMKRAETSGRADDNLETATLRLKTFHEVTTPTLEQLTASEIPIYKVDGRGSVQEVWEQCLDVCQPIRSRVEAGHPCGGEGCDIKAE